MHSHVEHLDEPAANAVVRVFPKVFTEVLESDEGDSETGEKTGLVTVVVTTDVLGRDARVTQLLALSVPLKLLRDRDDLLDELQDLEALATSLLALSDRIRTALHVAAATLQ